MTGPPPRARALRLSISPTQKNPRFAGVRVGQFRRTTTCTDRALAHAADPSSSALIQPRQHEFAMAERLGRRQPPVGGAKHALEQAVARLVEVDLALQKPRGVD